MKEINLKSLNAGSGLHNKMNKEIDTFVALLQRAFERTPQWLDNGDEKKFLYDLELEKSVLGSLSRLAGGGGIHKVYFELKVYNKSQNRSSDGPQGSAHLRLVCSSNHAMVLPPDYYLGATQLPIELVGAVHGKIDDFIEYLLDELPRRKMDNSSNIDAFGTILEEELQKVVDLS